MQLDQQGNLVQNSLLKYKRHLCALCGTGEFSCYTTISTRCLTAGRLFQVPSLPFYCAFSPYVISGCPFKWCPWSWLLYLLWNRGCWNAGCFRVWTFAESKGQLRVSSCAVSKPARSYWVGDLIAHFSAQNSWVDLGTPGFQLLGSLPREGDLKQCPVRPRSPVGTIRQGRGLLAGQLLICEEFWKFFISVRFDPKTLKNKLLKCILLDAQLSLWFDQLKFYFILGQGISNYTKPEHFVDVSSLWTESCFPGF